MRDDINAEMQLSPPPARPDAVLLVQPFAFAVNLQACAVDKKMQRLRGVKPLQQNGQATTASAQGCMIGDGDIDPERFRRLMAAGPRSDAAAGGTPGEVRGRSPSPSGCAVTLPLVPLGRLTAHERISIRRPAPWRTCYQIDQPSVSRNGCVSGLAWDFSSIRTERTR
jgi:hypothetical protein